MQYTNIDNRVDRTAVWHPRATPNERVRTDAQRRRPVVVQDTQADLLTHTATNVSIQARARAIPNATRAYVSIAVDVRVHWNVVADEDHLSKARERMSTSGIISIYLNHNHTLSIILYQS